MTQVLVVDDSLTLRQLIRAILEPAGYHVTEASDGVEGLATLRAQADLGSEAFGDRARRGITRSHPLAF